MTRDEAVRTLQGMKSDFPLPKAAQTQRAQNDALDVAIEVLKAEPCEDTVSRQAAIDALKTLPTWWADAGGYYGGEQPPMEALLDPNDSISAIENLPSTTPKPTEYEDAVNRQAVVKIFSELWDCIREIADAEEWDDVCKTTANELPSVTPRSRTGKWLINSDGYYPYCSECKTEPKSGEMTDFCPKCGAKMEG